MLFDVIIPTYNNLEELKKCLSGLDIQTMKDFIVWICVDGSTDGTQQYLSNTNYTFKFSVLEHKDFKNHGRAATRNLALPFLVSDNIAFLDSDLIPNYNFLEAHLQYVKSGFISLGKLNYSDTQNVWTQYAMSRGKGLYEHDTTIDYKYLETGNAAMPKLYFSKCGGFDENFKGYGGEDNELAFSIHEKFSYSKTISNHLAITSGTLGKELLKALEERRSFAQTNLPFLIQKHPNNTDVFNYNFLVSRLGRFLFSSLKILSFSKLSTKEKFISKLPFRNKLIHLLVFYYMYEGLHQKK